VPQEALRIVEERLRELDLLSLGVIEAANGAAGVVALTS